ncbi:MAG: hypothetical protein HY730_06430 [Candidatus Tectomicrobia bacterium]|uniref:Uncharacterized protein n=1 Tax=Tectimicrobiota bacterium TaxID=2528274 RepID=A0A933GNY0_UNCTE|nr:hypothetical protein [Candidatus Tectomicrobia bacterium]
MVLGVAGAEAGTPVCAPGGAVGGAAIWAGAGGSGRTIFIITLPLLPITSSWLPRRITMSGLPSASKSFTSIVVGPPNPAGIGLGRRLSGAVICSAISLLVGGIRGLSSAVAGAGLGLPELAEGLGAGAKVLGAGPLLEG